LLRILLQLVLLLPLVLLLLLLVRLLLLHVSRTVAVARLPHNV
jgi:hypothetical protein